jgi:hypothetical protein
MLEAVAPVVDEVADVGRRDGADEDADKVRYAGRREAREQRLDAEAAPDRGD